MTGTASEQTLRNVLAELESDTLPSDAATQTTLAAVLAAHVLLLAELKLKAKLTETQPVSLATMPTTPVQAGGGDKIFSYESRILSYTATQAITTSHYITLAAVPAGKVHVITYMHCMDATSVITHMDVAVLQNSTVVWITESKLTPAIRESLVIEGPLILAAGDILQVRFVGTVNGDWCYLCVNGYQMDEP